MEVATAGVLGTRPASHESVRASGSIGAAHLPEGAWTTIEVRDGEKGPLVVEVGEASRAGADETGGDGPGGIAVHHAGASSGRDVTSMTTIFRMPTAVTPLAELARVAKAEHRIEECLERAKGEAGLGDYQVRNWPGWHHHQTLSLLAAWFLNRRRGGGKIRTPALTSPQMRQLIAGLIEELSRRQRVGQAMPPQHTLAPPQRAGAVLLPSFT